jgi:hypothetical protein
MSIEADVMAAGSPRDALLILARAVDALRETPTLDSWTGWGTTQPDAPRPTQDTTAPGRPAPPVANRHVNEDEVRAFLVQSFEHGGAFDPKDPAAAAVLAQLQKDLAAATGPSEPDRPDYIVDTEGVVEIDMAPRSEEERAAREAFARDVLQLPLALGPHPEGKDWCEEYAKVGPMFLYIPDREMLLEYPEHVRRTMVEDVLSYDKRVGDELARDLLRRAADSQATALPIADSYDG